jgi:hypothetical protein
VSFPKVAGVFDRDGVFLVADPQVVMASSSQQQADRNLDECSLYGSWIFSVLGALIAIPVGIKKKSYAPLVFFGATGAMLDIVQSITDCERERVEKERAAALLAEGGGS